MLLYICGNKSERIMKITKLVNDNNGLFITVMFSDRIITYVYSFRNENTIQWENTMNSLSGSTIVDDESDNAEIEICKPVYEAMGYSLV